MSYLITVAAREALQEMGVAPTNILEVLNGSQIPQNEAEAKHFREVELFLLRHGLVKRYTPLTGHQLPGGWYHLQISEKGYRKVANNEDFTAEAAKDNPLDPIGYRQRPTKSYYHPYASYEEFEQKVPRWYRRFSYGKDAFKYDETKEQPLWWAKYRAKRRWKLFPEEHRWPEKRWERWLEFVFTNTKQAGQLIISFLIVGGIFFGTYYLAYLVGFRL